MSLRCGRWAKKGQNEGESAELARSNELARRMQEYTAICLRLADMAECNEDPDLVYEPPPPKLNGNG
jgi:hypothetical protein